jgi:hypothetical protein
MAGTILEKARKFDEEQSWLRQFVIPEEDRHLFTSMPWRSEYRRFRSTNVIPLERYRPFNWNHNAR